MYFIENTDPMPVNNSELLNLYEYIAAHESLYQFLTASRNNCKTHYLAL